MYQQTGPRSETWPPANSPRRQLPTPAEMWSSDISVTFSATSLFFDLRRSTDLLVHVGEVALARILQVFIQGAVEAVEREGGSIQHFNGDGALVLYTGERSTDSALKTATEILHSARSYVMQQVPELAEKVHTLLGKDGLDVTIGIDHSPIFAVAVGSEANPFTAWTGIGVHTAAKLSRLAPPDSIAITDQAAKHIKNDSLPAGSFASYTIGGVERMVYVTDNPRAK